MPFALYKVLHNGKDALIDFLKNSPTAYHACENVANVLEERGFTRLSETEDWALCENGKY